jgi:hypothetical protein
MKHCTLPRRLFTVGCILTAREALAAAPVGRSNPKDRAGLKANDPAGHALIEKLWGVHAPPPALARAGEDK